MNSTIQLNLRDGLKLSTKNMCDRSQEGPWSPLILLLYKIIKNLDFDPYCWAWDLGGTHRVHC